MGNKHSGEARSTSQGVERGKRSKTLGVSSLATRGPLKYRSSSTQRVPNNSLADGEDPRHLHLDSLSNPSWQREMKDWMASPDNPYHDVDTDTRMFVRGVRVVEHPDELFDEGELQDTLDILSTESSSDQTDGAVGKAKRLTAERLSLHNNVVYTSSTGLGSVSSHQTMDSGVDGVEEFNEILDENNARTFRSRDAVLAFCVNDPCEFQKKWGTSRARAGDWVIIKDGHDLHANTAEKFMLDYVAVAGKQHTYAKKTLVRAVRMDRPFKLPRANKHEIDYGRSGDYIVQNGDIQYIVLASDFERQYELAKSTMTQGLLGAIPRITANSLTDIHACSEWDKWGVEHDTVQSSTLEDMSLYTDELRRYLVEHVFSWDLDVFELGNMTKQWPLLHLSLFLFDHYDILSQAGVDRKLWVSFLIECDDAYLPNPYHNNFHASDVLSSAHFIVKEIGFMERMSTLETMGLFVACAVHDIAHPGTNNYFQINAMSPVAIRYNDQSVLENFHAATAFEILGKPKYKGMLPHKILDPTDRDMENERKIAFFPNFRKYIIELILATDLSGDVARPILNAFQSRAFPSVPGEEALSFASKKDRLLCLKVVIKCADLGHAAKSLALHRRWSDLVTEEFLIQIQKENDLGLPHMFNVSKDPIKFAESQIGFIRFVVEPCYRKFCEFIAPAGKMFNDNITANISHWNEQKRSAVAANMISRDPRLGAKYNSTIYDTDPTVVERDKSRSHVRRNLKRMQTTGGQESSHTGNSLHSISSSHRIKVLEPALEPRGVAALSVDDLLEKSHDTIARCHTVDPSLERMRGPGQLCTSSNPDIRRSLVEEKARRVGGTRADD